jgi:hypothetical protein
MLKVFLVLLVLFMVSACRDSMLLPSQVGCNAVLDPATFLGPKSVVYPLTCLRNGCYPAHTLVKNLPGEAVCTLTRLIADTTYTTLTTYTDTYIETIDRLLTLILTLAPAGTVCLNSRVCILFAGSAADQHRK